MENLDEPQVCVQLRKEKQDGQTVLIALFPYEISTYRGDITCFTYAEGHSSCEPRYIHETKPCNVSEEKELLSILKNAGYNNLKPIKKINTSRYQEAVKQAKKY